MDPLNPWIKQATSPVIITIRSIEKIIFLFKALMKIKSIFTIKITEIIYGHF